MNENNEPQAWEEELRNIYSLCIEAPGKRLMFENYLLPFIRTLRQKDKERLMEGIEKLWNKKTSLTQSTLPDGRIEYKQSAPYNVTEASLEDFKQLLNQIYE